MRPDKSYQLGKVRLSVWPGNESGSRRVLVERRYYYNNQWKSSSYFSMAELPLLQALIQKVIVEELGLPHGSGGQNAQTKPVDDDVPF